MRKSNFFSYNYYMRRDIISLEKLVYDTSCLWDKGAIHDLVAKSTKAYIFYPYGFEPVTS